MPKLELEITFEQTPLPWSPSELLETYLFGVPLKTQDGRDLSHQAIKFYIESATNQVEDWCGVKLVPQIIEETKDFMADDFRNWAYIRTSYPVLQPIGLDGYIQDTQQIQYPTEWLSSKKTSDGKSYERNLYLVPGHQAAKTNAIVYSGITPHLGFLGAKQIPNYWRLKYWTGFPNMPSDLLDFVGKLSSIAIFHIMGDLILGAGIASQSISIDGLSQSISSTSSATNAGYGARITGYVADLKIERTRLKDFYKGITFMAN